MDVRPGITDPASIKFRNENELMEKTEDPEKYYIEVIMQEQKSAKRVNKNRPNDGTKISQMTEFEFFFVSLHPVKVR